MTSPKGGGLPTREELAWHAFVAIAAAASPLAIVIGMHVWELFGPWGVVSIGGLTILEFLAGVMFGPHLDRQ